MIAVALVAPWWVLAYIVGGFWGVLVMAVLGLLGEVLLFALDEREARAVRRTVVGRWESWR